MEIIYARACELKDYDGEQVLVVSTGMFSDKILVPAYDVRQVLQYQNLVQVYHDNGIVFLGNPADKRSLDLIEELKALPDVEYRLIDSTKAASGRLSHVAGAVAFYSVFVAVVFGLIFGLYDDERQTQPLTYVLYLLPAFCIAYLARRGLSFTIEAVGDRLAARQTQERRQNQE